MKVYSVMIRDGFTFIESVFTDKAKAEARVRAIKNEWLEEAVGCDVDEHKNYCEITNCDGESCAVWLAENEVEE